MVEDDAAECGEMPGAYCWGCGVLHCDACEIKVHSNEITVCNVCQAPFYSAPGEDDASQFKLLYVAQSQLSPQPLRPLCFVLYLFWV